MKAFDIAQLDAELATHVATARESLVRVHAGQNGVGSGTILHRDGLVVTNAHVARDRRLYVTLPDGDEVRAKLLARDESLDLAVLAVDVRHAVPLPLGDSRKLRAGSLVIAIGHPWGVAGAATAGMVIAVGRPLEPLPYAGELIQVGIPLRPGHSGGPMLGADGTIVGVNTMIAGPHVGLAIPSAIIGRFLKQMLGTQRRHASPARTQLPA